MGLLFKYKIAFIGFISKSIRTENRVLYSNLQV